jgi:DNA-binding XRE family transcriptional regulator
VKPARVEAFDGLGPVLRELRVERGLTQVELAERSGVSKSMLSLYESAKQRPQLDTLERLLDSLEVGLGELAARLDQHRGSPGPVSKRRGPWRSPGRGPVSGSLPGETVAAATELLHGMADLLRYAVQGAPPGVGEPGAADPEEEKEERDG